MIEKNSVKTIAVSGGKGGVGKTCIAVNIATEIASHGFSVLLMDADLGMANVDLLLNLKPRVDLYHVVSGECELEEILVEGPAGVSIVPAASGIGCMANLSNFQHIGLIKAFADLSQRFDYLLVDTATGIAPQVINFTKAAQEIVVVVCDEPASITDAYGLIKVLNVEHGVKRFQILANMVADGDQGQELFTRLVTVAAKFLNVSLGYLGSIPMDSRLREAVQLRQAVTQRFPVCASSIAFQQIARRVMNLPGSNRTSGQVEFFMEQVANISLVQAGAIS